MIGFGSIKVLVHECFAFQEVNPQGCITARAFEGTWSYEIGKCFRKSINFDLKQGAFFEENRDCGIGGEAFS